MFSQWGLLSHASGIPLRRTWPSCLFQGRSYMRQNRPSQPDEHGIRNRGKDSGREGQQTSSAFSNFVVQSNPSVPSIPWFSGSVTSQAAPSLLCQLQVRAAPSLDLSRKSTFLYLNGQHLHHSWAPIHFAPEADAITLPMTPLFLSPGPNLPACVE